MTNDWKIVFDHNMKINSTYFSTDELDCEEYGCYSILSKLENYRNSDNKFEFKLVYPEFDESWNFIHWIQSSNPIKSWDQVRDFRLIDVQYHSSTSKRDFQGLARPINNWPKPKDKTMGAGNLCLLTGRRRPISKDEDEAALHYDYMLGMIFKGWNNYTAAPQTDGDNIVNHVQLYVKASNVEIVNSCIKNISSKLPNLINLFEYNKALGNSIIDSTENIVNEKNKLEKVKDKIKKEAENVINNMEEADKAINEIKKATHIGYTYGMGLM